MVQSYSLFVTDNEVTQATIVSDKNLLTEEVFWVSDTQSDEHLYQQIVYKVLTKPKRLMSHLQRIYFTYHHGMADQLYAALVDMFSVLNGKGRELCVRMVSSTRSLLTEQQIDRLVDYQNHQNTNSFYGNKFSLLTNGLEGTNTLLVVKKSDVANVVAHDPLMIARDYVEYSQLDAAIETLEAGVLETPERDDLQADLLELYKVTKSIEKFTKLRNSLIEKKVGLSAEWQELTDYFTELTNEE